jgi:hypothetical protein
MTTLTEGKHALEFLLSEATGDRSREQVTISSAAGALVAGTLLGKITSGGEYIAYDADSVDGSETAVAILAYNVPDSAADQKATVFVRDCEVIESELTGLDTPARADLLAAGIIVRA